MSLLGIDIGTSGCKSAVFDTSGRMLSLAYAEYDYEHPTSGWAELNTAKVWERICATIRKAIYEAGNTPIQALSISSMGEAVVPVSADRRILGPSLLNFDARGDEYLPELAEKMPDERLYVLNGNALGSPFGLTKLIWLKRNQPELYEATRWFLPWGGFAAFMLGAEAHADHSLANRLLVYSLQSRDWSPELLAWAGLDREKLPPIVQAGTQIGQVSRQGAELTGLKVGTPIINGGHDQQCNTIGCGVAEAGRAMYGMGSYLCAVPVFMNRPPTATMLANGLGTEDHLIAGQYVTFIYNQGGVLVKWYRDTFVQERALEAAARGESLYPALFAELPEAPSNVTVLPHFTTTGPPHFLNDSSGVLAGLRLETSRGEILKGILESSTFYIRVMLDKLDQTDLRVNEFVAAGGGSQSPAWLQLSADILGKPFRRLVSHEAGALGAAILAGAGAGVFSSIDEGMQAIVQLEGYIEPDLARKAVYDQKFEVYQETSRALEKLMRALPRG